MKKWEIGVERRATNVGFKAIVLTAEFTDGDLSDNECKYVRSKIVDFIDSCKKYEFYHIRNECIGVTMPDKTYKCVLILKFYDDLSDEELTIKYNQFVKEFAEPFEKFYEIQKKQYQENII